MKLPPNLCAVTHFFKSPLQTLTLQRVSSVRNQHLCYNSSIMLKPLFQSYIFIFAFLPVLVFGFFLIPGGAGRSGRSGGLRRVFLTAISLLFFACFGLKNFAIFLASVAANTVFALLIDRAADAEKRRKALLFTAIAANLALLGFYKYSGALPIAISFYTFQQISFLTDLSRGEIELDLPDYLLYITFFPKILQGPIVRYREMKEQFDRAGETRFSGERFLRGLFLFTLGLAKKVLLADYLSGSVDYGYSILPRLTWLDAMIVMIGFSLQLYLDFSGYCDMGEGVCEMIGIELPENFHLPYRTGNIRDFWNCWHITLSRFFLKYLYIPLGGNRKGKARTYLNLMIVFLLSGIWHGAGLTFLVWGGMHGVMSVLHRFLCDVKASKQGRSPKEITLLPDHPVFRFCSVILNFLYVSVAWVFFRADSVHQALQLLKIVFSKPWLRCSIRLAKSCQLDEIWYALKILHLDSWQYSGYVSMWIVLIVSALIAFNRHTFREYAQRHRIGTFTYVLLAVLFAWCVISLGEVSTFLYFKF